MLRGLAALPFGLALASGASAATVLHARLNSDIFSTEPGMRRDENTDAVLLHVVEGLVAAREDGSVAPMLASGWTVSLDGRAYTFALRDGVVFHNGAPLSSADVVWSLNRYFAADSHWRCKSAFGPHGLARVLAITPDGPRRVVVRLDRPAPFFLQTLARTDCGEAGIMQRASVGPDGRWRAPIGTGPFRFGEWRRGQYIDLLRFAAYKSLPGGPDGDGGGKHALVDRLRFLIIPDGSAASAALLRGSLDVLDGLAPNELGALRHASGVRMVSAPTMDFYAVLLQSEDPALRDPRMRQAIALCIDAPGLARVVGRGGALPDSSPVPVASPFHGPQERVVIRPDPAHARRLAAVAGYRGQPIRLITNRRYPQAFDAAVLIQAMARRAGIRMDIATLDWASEMSRYASGDYQAMVFGFSARLDPSLNFDILVGDRRTDRRKVWDTPAARALLQASMATGDRSRRQALFDRLDAEFRRDAPAVVLFNTRRITAVRDTVVGFHSWSGALQRLWDVGVAP